MHSDRYTLVFASVLTLICALILGGIAVTLKPLQEKNAEVFKFVNVLKGFGVYEESFSNENIVAFFTEKGFESKTGMKIFVVKKVFNSEGIDVTVDKSELKSLSLAVEMKKTDEKLRHYPIYLLYKGLENKKNDKAAAYSMPIFGYGLWSTCYGFLSLDADGRTVKGIVYYDQKETPGLGGEIINPKWQALFQGKTIFDQDGSFNPVQTSKTPKANEVQAVSAATFTMEGVNKMISKFVKIYQPYLKRRGN